MYSILDTFCLYMYIQHVQQYIQHVQPTDCTTHGLYTRLAKSYTKSGNFERVQHIIENNCEFPCIQVNLITQTMK